MIGLNRIIFRQTIRHRMKIDANSVKGYTKDKSALKFESSESKLAKQRQRGSR